jgi:hypothetical protein
MSGSFVKGAAVGLACAVLGGATVALAGSGVGGVFNLGVSNSVDAKTSLTGAVPAVQLQLNNTDPLKGSGLSVTSAGTAQTGTFANTWTGNALNATSVGGVGVFAQSGGATTAALRARNTGGGPAATFAVNGGVPPFTVSSTVKVAGLNADLIDGLDSTALKGPAGPPGPPGPAGPNPAQTISKSIRVGDFGTVLDLPGFLSMNASCPQAGEQTNYGFITSSRPVTLFADGGSPDPTLLVLAANTSNGSSFWDFSPVTDGFTFSASDGVHTATIWIFNRQRTDLFLHLTFCDFQGQAIVTP